jgi:hypothetical protein
VRRPAGTGTIRRRQDACTASSEKTRRAVLTVQSNGAGEVEAATALLARLIERERGVQRRIEVLDRRPPSAEFEGV